MEAFDKNIVCVLIFTLCLSIIETDCTKHFYAIEAKSNFYEAFRICERNGMHLATIESEEEEKFLEKHLTALNSRTFYINAKRREPYRTNIFEWQTYPKRVMSYTKWHEGEPNNQGFENCVIIMNRDGVWGWNDVPCGGDYNLSLICMKDDSDQENTDEPKPIHDYEYSDEFFYPRL